ncbi:MAG: trypsin-like serine protease [Minicystis sp.]
MRRLLLAPLACSLLFLAPGCGADPDDGGPLGQTRDAILDGTVDKDHTGVVAVFRASDGEFCSGYLIAPNLVLTAAHCTAAFTPGTTACEAFTEDGSVMEPGTIDQPFATSVFHVANPTVFTPAEPYTKVETVLLPPDAIGANPCGRDVSLLRLSAPIEGATPIEPRLDLGPIAGETFTATGYGATKGGTITGIGTRHARAAVPVTSVGKTITDEGIVRTVEADWTSGDGPCAGDSGSPAIDAAGRSFGVMSRGNQKTCTSMVYNGVTAHADWIRAEVKAAAAALGQPAPAWAEPPVAGSAGLGDDCRGETECEAPLSCRPIDDRFRCTSLDCDACAPGWICGTSAGAPACVPDPNGPPDAGPTDAGTGDAGVTDPGSDPDGGGGCAAAPAREGRSGMGAALVLLVLGAAAARGARSRREEFVPIAGEDDPRRRGAHAPR